MGGRCTGHSATAAPLRLPSAAAGRRSRALCPCRCVCVCSSFYFFFQRRLAWPSRRPLRPINRAAADRRRATRAAGPRRRAHRSVPCRSQRTFRRLLSGLFLAAPLSSFFPPLFPFPLPFSWSFLFFFLFSFLGADDHCLDLRSPRRRSGEALTARGAAALRTKIQFERALTVSRSRTEANAFFSLFLSARCDHHCRARAHTRS